MNGLDCFFEGGGGRLVASQGRHRRRRRPILRLSLSRASQVELSRLAERGVQPQDDTLVPVCVEIAHNEGRRKKQEDNRGTRGRSVFILFSSNFSHHLAASLAFFLVS